MTIDQSATHHAKIILAPPLSGCTTLASIHHDAKSLVLDVDVAYPYLRSRHLHLPARRAAIVAWLREAIHISTVICTPVIDDGFLADMTAGRIPASLDSIVIIPPAQFVKRAANPTIGDGHKIAAVAWRDAAIRVAQTTDAPVCSALPAVPLLQQILGVSGGFLKASSA